MSKYNKIKSECDFINRGFKIISLKDSNGVKFSIQESSSCNEDKIWLGADNIGLRVFKEGWQDVNLTELLGTKQYVANERLHLNKAQAKTLILILKEFVKTGYIPNEYEEYFNE